jgi:hypothetical protein
MNFLAKYNVIGRLLEMPGSMLQSITSTGDRSLTLEERKAWKKVETSTLQC